MLLFYQTTLYSLSLLADPKEMSLLKWIFFNQYIKVFSGWDNGCRKKMLRYCQCFVAPFLPTPVSLQFLFKSKVWGGGYVYIVKRKKKFCFRWLVFLFLKKRISVLSEKDYVYERLKFTWMVLRHGIVNCKSKLFTQFSKDWNGSLWSLRREEVTNHSADWHFNSLLYSDVLLQLLLSLFYIWRVWGGFIVILIPSTFKTLLS